VAPPTCADLARSRKTLSVTPERLREVVDAAVDALRRVTDGDWSKPAGSLEWSCHKTADHIVDCVFSYTLQLAARVPDRFLPFGELHALPEATPRDLTVGIAAVGAMLAAVASVDPQATASDGVMDLSGGDWCARGAFEIAVHTHDVLVGQHSTFRLDTSLCRAITESPGLWMFDRARARGSNEPWSALLLGAGRHVS
jgi:hypothetical protein